MPDLTVRSPRFDVAGHDLPRLWLGQDAFRTQIFNALSLAFPVGEAYFIDCVRSALPQVRDPALAEDMRRFIGQETCHSRLHGAFNRRLAEFGLRNYIGAAGAWRIRATRRFGLRGKLAVVAAYEHFTAAFGDAALRRPEWLDGAAAPLRALWMWHAAEECEHRAVAFEVYTALGGGYGRRIAWFLYVSAVFALDLAVQTLLNLQRGGDLWRVSTWRSAAGFLLGRRGLLWQIVPAWLAYFRPGFSPRGRGEGAAARRWLEANRQWFAPNPAGTPAP